MVIAAFISSVIASSIVLSLVGDVRTNSGEQDYHYVPFAGDVFGG